MDKTKLAKLMKQFPCKELETGNLRTCPARLSYPNIFEKSKGEEGYQAKYGATLLFPKGADLSVLEEAAKHAMIEKFGPKAGSMGLKKPFRDQGDKEGKNGYAKGALFFRANSEVKPGVLGPDGSPIIDRNDLYAGCWVIATVRPFGYTTGGKGVAFGLQNLFKIADDEPFGGTPADPNDEFADVLGGAAGTKALFGDDAEEDEFV